MDELEPPVTPAYRDELFMKMKAFADLEYLQKQYVGVSEQKRRLEEEMQMYEDAVILDRKQQIEYQKIKYKHDALTRREERLGKQIGMLTEQIRIEIEASKKEL